MHKSIAFPIAVPCVGTISVFIVDKNSTSAIILDMADDAGTTVAVRAKVESVNYFVAQGNIRLIMRQTFEDENVILLDWSYS